MSFGITELIIIMVIIILLFGTKKLSNLGSDLGGALKGFRSAMQDVEDTSKPEETTRKQKNPIIEGEIEDPEK